jgi:hypothetical protein
MSEECELNESHCYDYCNECSTCHICLNEWQIAGDDKIESLEADNKVLTAKLKEQADLLIECSTVLLENNFRGDLQDSISDLING